MSEQDLTPIMGPTMKSSMLKFIVKEIQQNSYTIRRTRAPKQGEVLVRRLYFTGARRAVVQRDDDTQLPQKN